MATLLNYQTFNPAFLFPINFREMDRKEAKKYFDWFMQQIPIRIMMLDHILNIDDGKSGFSLQTLVSLGRLLDENIDFRQLADHEILQEQTQMPSWFHDFIPNKVLSDQSISLCVDTGIVLGEMLISRHPNLKWEFNHKQKKDVNYQQPIITGFKNGIQLNPVRVISVVAYKTADGQAAQDQLVKLFHIWDEMF